MQCKYSREFSAECSYFWGKDVSNVGASDQEEKKEWSQRGNKGQIVYVLWATVRTLDFILSGMLDFDQRNTMIWWGFQRVTPVAVMRTGCYGWK